MTAAALASLLIALAAARADDGPDVPPSVPPSAAAPKAGSAEEARKLAAARKKAQHGKKSGAAAEKKPADDAPPDVPPSDGPPATVKGTATVAAKDAATAKVTRPVDDAATSAAEDTYTPPPQTGAAAASGLQIGGYADVGFARARGDGTSFAPNDTRLPADYGVDSFAPAVNSRGDVASTDSKGRFTNGFLPRSMGIGGAASFFVNTVDVDVRYQPGTAPVLLFTRLQVLPRFGTATDTRLVVEQAFARVIPFSTQELALFVGKFDPVFGIEYLENQANLRTGVTPSLVSRYTTGQVLGAKGFYRFQIPGLWSALSLNASATNGSPLIEPLQPADVSLTGAPVLAARAGYELNLPALQIKLGASGMRGPRNDQHRRAVRQQAWGVDARLSWGGLSLSGEIVHVKQDPGDGDKVDGLGTQTAVSGFAARGGYLQLAYGAGLDLGPLRKLTVYGVYSRRYAQFESYTPIAVDRVTGGFRADLWDSLAVKAEALVNGELWGAPRVDNDVFTSSVVYSF